MRPARLVPYDPRALRRSTSGDINMNQPDPGITGIRLTVWRRRRDSNPRPSRGIMISSAAPSTTRTTLRVYFRPVFFPEICSKIRWRENRRDGKKYSILRFSVLRNIKENQGDEIPSFRRNFESFSHLIKSRQLCDSFRSFRLRRKLLEIRLFRPESLAG